MRIFLIVCCFMTWVLVGTVLVLSIAEKPNQPIPATTKPYVDNTLSRTPAEWTALEILLYHNEHRTRPLQPNDKLNVAAQKHAEWMLARHKMRHMDANGDGAGGRIAAAGYTWSRWGENIAAGQETTKEVMATWMHSAGHRHNIQNENYTEIGVGRAGNYWCVVFATPKL